MWRGLYCVFILISLISSTKGAVILHSDPSCWDDVLLPARSVFSNLWLKSWWNISDFLHPVPPVKQPLSLQTSFFAVAVALTMLMRLPCLFISLTQTLMRWTWQKEPYRQFSPPQMPCLACTGVEEPVVVFSCRHLTCVPCFADYCRSKMGERQFVLDPDQGYTLSCPMGCEGSLITEPRHFKLMGQDVYCRWEQWLKILHSSCSQISEIWSWGAGPSIRRPSVSSTRLWCRNLIRGGRRLQKGALCYLRICLLQVIWREDSFKTLFLRDCLQGAHIGDCLLSCGTSGEGLEQPRLNFLCSSLSLYLPLQFRHNRPKGIGSQMEGCWPQFAHN